MVTLRTPLPQEVSSAVQTHQMKPSPPLWIVATSNGAGAQRRQSSLLRVSMTLSLACLVLMPWQTQGARPIVQSGRRRAEIFRQLGKAAKGQTSTDEPTPAPTEYGFIFRLKSSTPTITAFPAATPMITAFPAASPSFDQTKIPGSNPTQAPTSGPTQAPTSDPTQAPTSDPSQVPSAKPTTNPMAQPNPEDNAGPGSGSGTSTNPDNGKAGNVNLSNTAVSCEGLTTDRKEEVWWEYSVELSTGKIDPRDPVNQFELYLFSEVKDDLLQCENPQRSRRLAGDFGISAMDYKPEDKQLLDKACPDPKDNCYVFRGLMDLYLLPVADKDIAVLEARKAIRVLMSKTDGLDVTGIDKVEYLAPGLSDASAATEGETRGIKLSNNDGTLDSGMLVLVALGSFFVVVATIAAYRFKRNDENSDKDGPLTIATGSQITGASSNISADSSTLSPFSAMLPNAYRMNEPYSMSAILEDSDSASNARDTSDIIVSESGYTEDDSRDNSYLQSIMNDPVLGAEKMEDYEEGEDFIFDTGEASSETGSDIDV